MEQQKEITHQTWDQQYEEIKKVDNYVVYLTGSINEEGINWCSDCVETKSSVEAIEADAKSQNIPFLVVRAGLRDAWRDAQNSLRVHKQVKATSIPTVILFQKGMPLKKIGYDELKNQEIVKSFLEDL